MGKQCYKIEHRFVGFALYPDGCLKIVGYIHIFCDLKVIKKIVMGVSKPNVGISLMKNIV